MFDFKGFLATLFSFAKGKKKKAVASSAQRQKPPVNQKPPLKKKSRAGGKQAQPQKNAAGNTGAKARPKSAAAQKGKPTAPDKTPKKKSGSPGVKKAASASPKKRTPGQPEGKASAKAPRKAPRKDAAPTGWGAPAPDAAAPPRQARTSDEDYSFDPAGKATADTPPKPRKRKSPSAQSAATAAPRKKAGKKTPPGGDRKTGAAKAAKAKPGSSKKIKLGDRLGKHQSKKKGLLGLLARAKNATMSLSLDKSKGPKTVEYPTVDINQPGAGKTKSKKGKGEEAALGFSIATTETKRRAVRLPTPTLVAVCEKLGADRKCKDLSALGIGIDFEKPRVKAGTELIVTIREKDTILIRDLVCKVRRHEQGILGCEFTQLTRRQDDALSKVLLREQKRQAALRKKKSTKTN